MLKSYVRNIYLARNTFWVNQKLKKLKPFKRRTINSLAYNKENKNKI